MEGDAKSARGIRRADPTRPALPGMLTLFFWRFFVAAFARRFQPLFTALGAVRGALHQLGTHQLDDGLLGAIAFAGAQARNAGVAALPLAEPRAQRIEQLLQRIRRTQHPGRLAARA